MRPKYDPTFGDEKRCRCGHPYYRHFDSHEDMMPVGCKYCGCTMHSEEPYDTDKPDAESKAKVKLGAETGAWWEARAEYQASDGRWLRLIAPGVDESYHGSTLSKAIKSLMDAWAKALDRVPSGAWSRIDEDTNLRITFRRVPAWNIAPNPSADFHTMVKKAMRTTETEEIAWGEAETTIEVKDGSGRVVAAIDRDSTRGWDWAKRLSEDRPKGKTLRETKDDPELEALIDATPDDFYDRDGYVEEPMEHDVPIELLPDIMGRTPTKRHLSGTRLADPDEDDDLRFPSYEELGLEAKCRWCDRPVDVCPFPDDAVAHGLRV